MSKDFIEFPFIPITKETFERQGWEKHTEYEETNSEEPTKYTYYINLEHRKDRMKETIEELKNFGIDNPIRFNAIKDEKIDVWVVVNLI